MRERDDFDVATVVNYGVVSYLSWSTSRCNPEMGNMRIRGPKYYCLLSKVNALNDNGHAGLHLSPLRASSLVTWLVEIIRFTLIPPL